MPRTTGRARASDHLFLRSQRGCAMAKKALCLSGGAARGSFQMGAIKCLYETYGFRPDIITGTSVGAVNGIDSRRAAAGGQRRWADSPGRLGGHGGRAARPHPRTRTDLAGRQRARRLLPRTPPFRGTLIDDTLSENGSGAAPSFGQQVDYLKIALNLPHHAARHRSDRLARRDRPGCLRHDRTGRKSRRSCRTC